MAGLELSGPWPAADGRALAEGWPGARGGGQAGEPGGQAEEPLSTTRSVPTTAPASGEER
ncbi:hypothetical protein SMALB_7323 [Streptomyces malaysiensis]|uniref:Uncharacterized protein n=1 Tax=Streptomyces malaysiensis TaxID=92644 RepID=A0A7X6B0K9_STRMQ|nr:hypothetical protein [Streptomyces malaysiensis]